MNVPGRYLAGLAAVLVLAVVIIGLRITGSPDAARRQQADKRRIEHLREIAAAVNLYWTRRQEVPPTLEDVSASGQPPLPRRDPVSTEPYEYRAVDRRTFELCANFEQPSEAQPRGDFWQHQAGRQCFQLSAEAVRP